MVENKYAPGLAPAALEPIFAQLATEFASEYEIWIKTENLGRCISAAVLNPRNRISETISLADVSRTRSTQLSVVEINSIRTHLESTLENQD